jgi:hypothetical protein
MSYDDNRLFYCKIWVKKTGAKVASKGNSKYKTRTEIPATKVVIEDLKKNKTCQ